MILEGIGELIYPAVKIPAQIYPLVVGKTQGDGILLFFP
jgi:hypothetical protein